MPIPSYRFPGGVRFFFNFSAAHLPNLARRFYKFFPEGEHPAEVTHSSRLGKSPQVLISWLAASVL
jgi:hypothetical protein